MRAWWLWLAVACRGGSGDRPPPPPQPASPSKPSPSFAVPGQPLRPPPTRSRPAPKDPAIGLAGAGDMTCALRASGAVTCWGGPFGAPHQVPLGGDVVKLVIDFGEVCALHRDGHVDCFALGDKLDESHLGLTRVTGIAFATELASGGEATCVLEKSRDVACWSGDHAATRTRLRGASSLVMTTLEGPDWQFPGVALVCALVAGELACIDVFRQAEQSRTDPRTPLDRYLAAHGTRPKLSLGTPKVVLANASEPFVPEEANAGTMCAHVAGAPQCVGVDLSLAIEPEPEPAVAAQRCTHTATSVTCAFSADDPETGVALDHPVEVSWVHDHACARYGAGRVACWGANGQGALGRATPNDPAPVWGLDDATDIASFVGGVIALRANGQVAYWGSGEADEHPDAFRTSVPVTLSAVRDATKLVAGHFHACVLRATGDVACWVEAGAGGTAEGAVKGVEGLHGVRELAATDFGLVARIGDGTLVHVGDVQLGPSASSTPKPIIGAEHAAAIAVAGTWVCALDAAPGSVRCWIERDHTVSDRVTVADDVVELAASGPMFAGRAATALLVVRKRDGSAQLIALSLEAGKPFAAPPKPFATGVLALFVSETVVCARGAHGTTCVNADGGVEPPTIPRDYDGALALTVATPACALLPTHHVQCFAATDEWSDGTGRGASRMPVEIPLD